MVFSDAPSLPTSVLGAAGGTRWSRSPAAIAIAVFSTRCNGRKLLRTNRYPSAPTRSTTPTPIPSCSQMSRVTVSSTSVSLMATMAVPVGEDVMITRQWGSPPPADVTVTGSGPNFPRSVMSG